MCWKTDRSEAGEPNLSPEHVTIEMPLDIKVEILSWQLDVKYEAQKTDLGRRYTFGNFGHIYVN